MSRYRDQLNRPEIDDDRVSNIFARKFPSARLSGGAKHRPIIQLFQIWFQACRTYVYEMIVVTQP